jgi:hypothetical protein
MPTDRKLIVGNLLRVLREWQRECEQLPHSLTHPVLREQYGSLASKIKLMADELEVGGTVSILSCATSEE